MSQETRKKARVKARSVPARAPPKRALQRSVSLDGLRGHELLDVALSRFEASRTTWPGRRFRISGWTGDVCRAHAHMTSPGRSVVVVCRNVFTPVPPKQLKRLGSVVRQSAKPIYDEPNAGGSSEQSEAVSFAMLRVLFGAQLVATEMQVNYWKPSKIIDYVVSVDNKVLGVSVTRAYRFEGRFERCDASELLTKKLLGLFLARRAVCDAHAWDIGVLHIWCATEDAARLLARQLGRHTNDIWPLRLFALAAMPAPVVMLTSSSSIDHIIFKNNAWGAPTESLPSRHDPQSVHAARRRALNARRQATYAALLPHQLNNNKTRPCSSYHI